MSALANEYTPPLPALPALPPLSRNASVVGDLTDRQHDFEAEAEQEEQEDQEKKTEGQGAAEQTQQEKVTDGDDETGYMGEASGFSLEGEDFDEEELQEDLAETGRFSPRYGEGVADRGEGGDVRDSGKSGWSTGGYRPSDGDD